jgi:ribonuclease D
MSYRHVTDEGGAARLADELADHPRFALDCEAAGFHRYTDRLCLVQITTPAETYVVDPFQVDCDALLRRPLEDPEVEVVMHGADYDLRLLDRDLDIRLKGLFDTQIAAQLLGENAIGLASLLESRLGVTLAKKYQRADWAKRPLPDDMLAYAASDTRHLLELADIMEGELGKAERRVWATEEARALEEAATGNGEEPEEDPVTRVKGARDLPPRAVTALREALAWRDELARARDKAPFRVVNKQPLLQAALEPPRSADELAGIKGFPRGLARAEGEELLRRLERVARLPDDALVPYPEPERNGPGRPPPEVEEMTAHLKDVRNRKADELGMDRGVLLPNATLERIAWEDPGDLAALRRVDGIRRWQVEAMGEEIVETLLQKG